MKLVVATGNPGKLREMRELLDLPGLTLVSLGDLYAGLAPLESGSTLIENALIKARAARRHTGLAAVADDTGLEVDVLGGAPGVHTARYAGPDADPSQNLRRLLGDLVGVPGERRGARFRTVCAVVLPEGEEVVSEGVLEGRITVVPRGSMGFGYDPVFEPAGETRTLAEMTLAEKNRISHRSRAVRRLRELLGEMGRWGG